MSSLIAVVAALGAALLLGISSVADQRSTKRVERRRVLSPRIFVDLARQPLWLTALATNVAGFALQVVALGNGSIAVVQPIMVCDLVFAVLIAFSLGRRRLLDQPGVKRTALFIFIGVGAAAGGVAGFLAIGRPSAGTTHASLSMLPPLAGGLIVVVGGCLVVAARNHDLRPLALALACGVNYGVAAFTVKLVTSEFGRGLSGVLTNWPIYVLAVVGPLGFLLNQDAFQQGTFLAPVQAIITSADPVISIALGITWLNVRLNSGPGYIAGEVLSLLVMITGIAVITSHTGGTAGLAPVSSGPGPAVPAERDRRRLMRPAVQRDGPGHEVDRHGHGTRRPPPFHRGFGGRLGDPVQHQAVPGQGVEVGRDHPVAGADPAAVAGVAGQPPAFVEIAPVGGPAAGRVAVPARKAGMQQREHEPAARAQPPGDVGHQAIEVIDVGQPVVAHHAVERRALQHARGGHVRVHVVDAQGFRHLVGPRLGQQRPGDVRPGQRGAAARKFPGHPARPAGGLQQPQPADLPRQVQQRRGRRIADALARLLLVEIGHLVVTRHHTGHTPTVIRPAPSRRRRLQLSYRRTLHGSCGMLSRWRAR
jgi:hypothetical protein